MGKHFVVQVSTAIDEHGVKRRVLDVVAVEDEHSTIGRIEEALDVIQQVEDVATNTIRLPTEQIPELDEDITVTLVAKSEETVSLADERLLRGVINTFVDDVPQAQDAFTLARVTREEDLAPVPEDVLDQSTGRITSEEDVIVSDPVIQVQDGDATFASIEVGEDTVSIPVERTSLTGVEASEDPTTVEDQDTNPVTIGAGAESPGVADAVERLLGTLDGLDVPDLVDQDTNPLDILNPVEALATAEERSSTFDTYAALSDLTAGASAATVPDGGLDSVVFDADRALGTVMVGEADTDLLPNLDLDSILYHFLVPQDLTSDLVHLKWELPPPNFVENWHFATDPIGNEWTVVGDNVGIEFTHDTSSRGFRSTGTLNLDSSTTGTDRDQIHQRVTGLATGAGRTVTVKVQHRDYQIGLAVGNLEMVVYADSNGTKGAELARVTLTQGDSAWTAYSLQGDASGTLDFTIADDVTALWVEFDANDTNNVEQFDRAIDDVRCEVTGLGEQVIAEQTAATYPTEMQQPYHLRKTTLEAYANGDTLDTVGFDTSVSSNGTVQVSNDNPRNGTLNIHMDESSDLTDESSSHAELSLDQGLSKGLIHVPFAPTPQAGSTEFNVRFYDGATEVLAFEGEAEQQDLAFNVIVEGVNVTPGTIDPEVGGAGVYSDLFVHMMDDVVHVRVVDGGTGDVQDESTTALSQVFSIDRIRFEVVRFNTDTAQDIEVDVDDVLISRPVAVDVSAHGISRSEVSELLAWVEHVDGGDGVDNALVESIGLRYTS